MSVIQSLLMFSRISIDQGSLLRHPPNPGRPLNLSMPSPRRSLTARAAAVDAWSSKSLISIPFCPHLFSPSPNHFWLFPAFCLDIPSTTRHHSLGPQFIPSFHGIPCIDTTRSVSNFNTTTKTFCQLLICTLSLLFMLISAWGPSKGKDGYSARLYVC